MPRWFLVLALLFLAACQQAPAAGTAQPTASSSNSDLDHLPDDWSASGGATASRYFAAEEKELGKRMAAGLFVGCYRHARDTSSLDECLRQGVVDSFDDSGQGRQYCKSQSDIEDFTDCIVLGNAAVDMLHRMGSKAEIDAATWAGRRSFADAMTKVAVTAGIMACGDSQTKASAEICAFEWYKEKLAVPEALVKRCSADLSGYERGACLGQASMIRFIEEHVARLPGIGI